MRKETKPTAHLAARGQVLQRPLVALGKRQNKGGQDGRHGDGHGVPRQLQIERNDPERGQQLQHARGLGGGKGGGVAVKLLSLRRAESRRTAPADGGG